MSKIIKHLSNNKVANLTYKSIQMSWENLRWNFAYIWKVSQDLRFHKRKETSITSPKMSRGTSDFKSDVKTSICTQTFSAASLLTLEVTGIHHQKKLVTTRHLDCMLYLTCGMQKKCPAKIFTIISSSSWSSLGHKRGHIF